MCTEYARRIGIGEFIHQLGELTNIPSFTWTDSAASLGTAQFHIRIGDEAAVVRLEGHHLVGEMMSWGWKDGRQIVFNMKSEDCDFSGALRVLVLATGFYEYTEPEANIASRERHLFTMKGEEWFWIAGIAQHGNFAMLTTRPGADIKPYHKRQICLLPAAVGMDWLLLDKPQDEILRATPAGTLAVKTYVEMSAAPLERYSVM